MYFQFVIVRIVSGYPTVGFNLGSDLNWKIIKTIAMLKTA